MKILETYRNTPYDKDGPGLVLITDAMPDWNQAQWREVMQREGIKPDPPPFRPGFLLVFGFDSVTNIKWEMNSRLFADPATVAYIVKRYGTGETREASVLGPGPFVLDRNATEFKIADGRFVNVGMIASLFERNPEDEAPGVADKAAKAALGL